MTKPENPKMMKPETEAEGTQPIDIFAEAVAASKEISTAGPRILRKPRKIVATRKIKGWFQVHPNGVYSHLALFKDPDDEAGTPPQLLAQSVIAEMQLDPALVYFTGYLLCTRNGAHKLWLVPEATPDGRMHEAVRAKHEAADEAQESWVKLTWQADVMAYDLSIADGVQAEPVWPGDISLETVLRSAFARDTIDDINHPILRRHRGEV